MNKFCVLFVVSLKLVIGLVAQLHGSDFMAIAKIHNAGE